MGELTYSVYIKRQQILYCLNQMWSTTAFLQLCPWEGKPRVIHSSGQESITRLSFSAPAGHLLIHCRHHVEWEKWKQMAKLRSCSKTGIILLQLISLSSTLSESGFLTKTWQSWNSSCLISNSAWKIHPGPVEQSTPLLAHLEVRLEEWAWIKAHA